MPQNEEQKKKGAEESQGPESASLKEREYRDEKGEVHHHTKEYMDRHGKEGR